MLFHFSASVLLFLLCGMFIFPSLYLHMVLTALFSYCLPSQMASPPPVSPSAPLSQLPLFLICIGLSVSWVKAGPSAFRKQYKSRIRVKLKETWKDMPDTCSQLNGGP